MKKKLPVVLHQLSNFSSGLGNSIVMITIPWLILEETGSPAFAGLVAAISALPGLGLLQATLQAAPLMQDLFDYVVAT
jgi:hypothetical protein